MAVQKQLTQGELSDFSLDKAKLIVGEYLRFESQNDLNVYEFEDVLPWKKTDIVVAFLKIMRETNEQQIKDICSGKIMDIVMTYILNPDDYKKALSIKEMNGLIMENDGNIENLLNKFKEKDDKK